MGDQQIKSESQMKNNDRHENKNWSFLKAKPDDEVAGNFIRLYRSTTLKNPTNRKNEQPQ